MRIEKDLSGFAPAHTRCAYEKGLDQFFAWPGTKSPQSVSKELLAEYRASLLELNLSPSTINLRLSPLRRLARGMAEKRPARSRRRKRHRVHRMGEPARGEGRELAGGGTGERAFESV